MKKKIQQQKKKHTGECNLLQEVSSQKEKEMKEEKEKQEEKILTKLQEDFKQEIEKYENKRKVDQIGKKRKKQKREKWRV